MLATTLTSSRIETRPNWAEVSLSALRHNFRVVQKHVGADVTICAVVKCNAYGHGVEECAPALEQAGAKWFGVTSTDEGVVLRECGVHGRILIMCGLYPGEEEEAIRHSLTPAVFRLQQAEDSGTRSRTSRGRTTSCNPSQNRYRHGPSGTAARRTGFVC